MGTSQTTLGEVHLSPSFLLICTMKGATAVDGVKRIQKGALGVPLDQQRFLGKVAVLTEATPMDVFQEMVNFITHLHMDEILKTKNN